MIWIATSEKDTDTATIEKRLWDAAGQFRANSGLKSQESEETGRLCRLNLAVHGLEGEIKPGGNINSYYDDPRDPTDRFDFVLPNPPFIANAVDTAMRVSARRQPEGSPQDLPARQDHERLKDIVRANRRFPFGLPRTDNATTTLACAKTTLAKPDRKSVGATKPHYLWIQLFHSALNEKSRAGIVMANATKSGHSCLVSFPKISAKALCVFTRRREFDKLKQTTRTHERH